MKGVIMTLHPPRGYWIKVRHMMHTPGGGVNLMSIVHTLCSKCHPITQSWMLLLGLVELCDHPPE